MNRNAVALGLAAPPAGPRGRSRVGGRSLSPRARALAAVLASAMAFSGASAAAPAAPPLGQPVAAAPALAPAAAGLTYADLADLAGHAPTVLRLSVRSTARVEAERAPGLRPGYARLYVEGRVIALLAGPALTGDTLRYLVDVPLDARGKLPRRPKHDVLVFARTRPDHPGELQLIAPDAQIAWSADTEARVKAVLGELLAAGAPPAVSGAREAIYVPGTLAGEGESQLFLATADGEPASITVVHRPGESPRWSVSFSEVLDSRGEPPARDTLPWYRLACFLPARLAGSANVSGSPADKAQAEADYQFVRSALGDCPRTRG